MLEIVKASAGSGKTYELTGQYIQMLFKESVYTYSNYKTILAVTFTNKATSEMKERILKELSILSTDPLKSNYLDALRKMPLVLKNGGSDPVGFIKEHSSKLLISILNDYSYFNVSTIDRFLQRVMRSFAREIGQYSSYNVELDHSDVLSYAVDMLMSSVDSDPKLLEWLLKLSKSQMEDGKNWDVTSTLLSLSNELFKEKFKLLKNKIGGELPSKDEISEVSAHLDKIVSDFRARYVKIGEEAKGIMKKYSLDPSDFSGASKSPMFFFDKIANGKMPDIPKKFFTFKDEGISCLVTKKSPKIEEIKQAFDAGLADLVLEVADNKKIVDYNTAVAVRKTINILGILKDIEDKVMEYCRSKNLVLLSETTNFLSRIIDGSDTPFLYERVGGQIDNYLLDEFQDTSNMQWQNFMPLIREGIDNGHKSLVVGDVKQSIYRWRGSDWSLLNEHIYKSFDQRKIHSRNLEYNWRSSVNVVNFNNSLFEYVDVKLKGKYPGTSLGTVYNNAAQKIDSLRKATDGHVYVKLIKIEGNKSMANQDFVQKEILDRVKDLMDGGYSQKDIAVLVRSNKEGEIVSQLLISNGYNVVTEDSLLLSSALSVQKVIAVLKQMDGSGNQQIDLLSEDWNPDDIKEKSLYNICEEIFSKQGEISDKELPFVNAFLDNLLEFVSDSGSDLVGFLKWWDEKGVSKNISAPDADEAIRVMTIHKSKGLEFKAVIIPFVQGSFAPSSKGDSFLWIEPDKAPSPYNSLPILPLKLNKSLLETHFAQEYHKEAMINEIDSLNIYYVAFTRAKEQLVVFVKDMNDAFAQYVKEFLENSENEYIKGFVKHPESRVSEIGEWENPDKKKTEVIKEDAVSDGSKFVNIPIGERLSISFKGDEYFSTENGDDNRTKGIVMHEIMSEIKVAEDIKGAVQRAVASGKVPSENYSMLCNLISKKISSVAEYHWFDGSCELMTETAIITATGESYRPDRVMIFGDKAVVLDYKFGNKKDSSYQTQVANYMKLLQSMGYGDVKGFLWYNDGLEEVFSVL